MALVTTVKYIITFAFVNILFIFLGPLLKGLRYDYGLWDNLPLSELVFGDQLYAIWVLCIIIANAMLIILAWREAENKAAIQ